MALIGDFLRKIGLGRRTPELTDQEAEELREGFRARYHNFKLLLAANNKALDIMADIEEALLGRRVFGQSFIRANCTAVSVNVFRIVQNLDQLASGKYQELYGRLKNIQAEINRVLSQRKPAPGDRLVIPFREIDKDLADQVGSKMANLGEVANRLGLPTPDGFAVTSLAYRRFLESSDLQTEIDRRLQASTTDHLDDLYQLSADIQQLIIRSPLPAELETALLNAYAELEARSGPAVKVSLRSSALGEDTGDTSFAGQYRSELNVSPDDIIQAYKEIIASKYSLPAIAYRLNRGILDEDVAMCVGCLVMIDAAAGGVTYSRNPLNIRDEAIIINSVWGLPKSVVDGSVAPDAFTVARGEPLTITRGDISHKRIKLVCHPGEGLCRQEVNEETAASPSLRDDQILELARLALRLEEHYGQPQDVEWALSPEGSIYILQCRPLMQVRPKAPDPPDRAVNNGAGQVLLRGGLTASPGVASGPVFIAARDSDALQFPEGGILVTPRALPRWAALLGRAAAVITEQGSVAGHLASVAREFGVPALFGLPEATEILTYGQEVTVDADALQVHAGRLESLLTRAGGRQNLMTGSPVHELLKEVARHIVPLNLLDPDASDFKPRNCHTLHDITRFCHEMSVREMFSFGKEHHFSERSSKQLVCDVPMLWWIINLDDGFKEDVPGQFVPLANIVSIPMLALWQGITAVPWAGPPPVDTRGFMSVLLEATANPELESAMPSQYTNRNYFMISRNFCSLSSRFGFHFCTVESLVGERPSENYASFQFKGGAADFSRRLRRARFVSGLLEAFDFRTEIKEDGVFARLEGYDEEFMKVKLKVLGYLLIHTRQLDMIMSNDTSYQQHWDKIMGDLRALSATTSPAPAAGG
ncbi:MAG: PEP/pyruvate-binding domain-containing protein [Thermodesulfobacteriota bacterium]